jgi:hypothetical protein
VAAGAWYDGAMRDVHHLCLGILLCAPLALPAPARAEAPACKEVDWAAGPRQLPPLLGAAKVERGAKLITDFSLDKVAGEAASAGQGGVTGEAGALRDALGNCSDSPSGEKAKVGARYEDPKTGLFVEVTAVEPAGQSGRKWEGVRCSYRIGVKDDPSRYVTLGADAVPPFNVLSGLQRDHDAVYASLQFNGYAKEIGNKGNLVLGLDLCRHNVAWRSRDLASNAALLLYRDYLITGYGFTKELSRLFVLNRWTGNPAQLIALPKSPSDLRVQEGKLYVRLYDGYAAFPLLVK